jgi:uncharacterized protein
LLRAVDRAGFAVALARRLRGAGVPVDLTAVETLGGALSVCPPRDKTRLYWLARTTLLRDWRDIARFDEVFRAVFADAVLAADPHARRTPAGSSTGNDAHSAVDAPGAPPSGDGAGLPWLTLPAVTGTAAGLDGDVLVPDRLPSRLTGLADTPFDELDPADLAALGAWFEASRDRWPTRRTRRMARRPGGRYLDLRATVARSRRTGWEPVGLVRLGPVDKPRRVVMICDVSQSMQAFTATYLHLMRAAVLWTGAEVFAFATSLTRLTPVLAHRSAAEAMEQAAALVTDRFGGTRIASNLRALLASRHGGAVRGAVVIIASDGWDSERPEALAAAMARLRRRAYRVIWMNPRAAAAEFVPLAGAMAAALPYCDDLLPGHTAHALDRVIEAAVRR